MPILEKFNSDNSELKEAIKSHYEGDDLVINLPPNNLKNAALTKLVRKFLPVDCYPCYLEDEIIANIKYDKNMPVITNLKTHDYFDYIEFKPDILDFKIVISNFNIPANSIFNLVETDKRKQTVFLIDIPQKPDFKAPVIIKSSIVNQNGDDYILKIEWEAYKPKNTTFSFRSNTKLIKDEVSFIVYFTEEPYIYLKTDASIGIISAPIENIYKNSVFYAIFVDRHGNMSKKSNIFPLK